MKEYNTKMLISGIVHSSIVLGFYLYALIVNEPEIIIRSLHYYSIFCLIAADIRWRYMYDTIKPNSYVLGGKLFKKIAPCFIDEQPKMNAIMVRTYIWLAIVIIGIFTCP